MKPTRCLFVAIALIATLAGCGAGRDDAAAGLGLADAGELFQLASGPRLTAGTTIPVRLLHPISSESATRGDPWTGVVTANVNVGGRLVVPAGSLAEGEVTDVIRARRGDRAMLQLVVCTVTVNGRPTALDAVTDPVIAGSPRALSLGADTGGGLMASRGLQANLKRGTVMVFSLRQAVALN